MSGRNIGVLHPGAMGVTVARGLQDSGHRVGWVSAGRSRQTQQRASGLHSFNSIDDIAGWADALISVCPPHAAVALAQAVHSTGFTGFYVDANALAPSTSLTIAELLGAGAFVDGGIIGPPAIKPGSTRLYLSGHHAQAVSSWFSKGSLEAIALPMSDAPKANVAASTLKMAYAAYSKGASALLLSVNALAEAGGVREALHQEWGISSPDLLKRSEYTAAATSGKAWRFAGEMLEISETYSSAGLPDSFHTAAAAIYERMQDLKDLPPQTLNAVVAALLERTEDSL